MTFKEYCEQNMSAHTYNRLHEVLKTTKYSVTQMLNNPTKHIKANQIITLAKLLPDKRPIDLVHEWNVGIDNITAREYLMLKEIKK